MTEKSNSSLSFFEFIALMALIISLGALSIDSILPAFPFMAKALGVVHENNLQLVVTLVLLGTGLGQIFYGPFSDSFGRRPTLFLGLAVYMAGSLLSIVSVNLSMMLVGRFIQGLGLASTRVVVMAITRDLYAGKEMGRVMSFVMIIFIAVPIFAPMFGAFLLKIGSWHLQFVAFIVLAAVTLIWFGFRQEETLVKEYKRPFQLAPVLKTFAEVFSNRTVMLHVVASGMALGCFLAYLSAAQQIFERIFAITDAFPYLFALTAVSIGLASFTNSRFVMKFGLARLVMTAQLFFLFFSITILMTSIFYDGKPPFGIYLVQALPLFFTYGFIFGNLNAMAMVPLGHLAGLGAAVVGLVSTLVAVILGSILGQSFHESLVPFFVGYVILGTLTFLVMVLAHRLDPMLGE